MMTDNFLIDVSLCLRGPDLDPDFITELLGINPTSLQKREIGQETTTSRKTIDEIGVWKFSAKSDSFLISDHIMQLTSNILVGNITFSELKGIQEAFVDVFMATTAVDDGGRGTCQFELSKESLVALVRLGLPVQFTVCVVKDSSELPGVLENRL